MEKTRSNYSGIVSWNSPAALVSMALLLGLGLVVGCSSSKRTRFELPEEAVIAQPPAFLTGPAAVLLTNLNAFSARVSIVEPGATGSAGTNSGRVLSQNGQLIYAPTDSDKTYIWDVQKRSGYILSEALQGYAPFSSTVEVTNVLTLSQTAGPAGQTVNGHPGHEVQMALLVRGGLTNLFSVWRATDLGGFPAQIKTMGAPAEFTLNFSEVRPENLSPKLFLPPEGFSKYANAQAIASELLARKQKLRSTGNTVSRDYAKPPPPPAQRQY